MDSETLRQVCPMLVAGYGVMGAVYVKTLHELGVNPHDILIVDRERDRRSAALDHWPGARVCEDVESALQQKPQVALVLVNSPEHLSVIAACLQCRVENIFVEKPLVLADQLPAFSRLIENYQPRGTPKMFVGYLINFSGAVSALQSYMRTHQLVAVHVDARWGKDRLADAQQRPSAGDLEDEATHPLGVAHVLTAPWTRGRVDVYADLTRFDFTDETVQRAAHERDTSYPERPESGSNITLYAQGSSGLASVWIRSSFLSFKQERVVDVLLASAGTLLRPTAIARLEFDVSGRDRLLIRALGSKVEPEAITFPSAEKLRAQLEAFLVCPAPGPWDPRLVHFKDAEQLVKISAAARKSVYEGRSIDVQDL